MNGIYLFVVVGGVVVVAVVVAVEVASAVVDLTTTPLRAFSSAA